MNCRNKYFLKFLLLISIFPAAFLGAAEYLASSGFSNTQGKNGWYYFESDGDSLKELTYNSETNLWSGSNSFLYVAPNQSRPHPGLDAVRAWVAPSDGKVSITGSVNRPGVWGDGIVASIVHNSDELWSATVAPQERATPEGVSDIDVKKGDVFYFTVNANETRASDHTTWDPSVNFIPSTAVVYSASEGFTDTQGENGWYYLESSGGSYSNLTYNSDINRWEGRDPRLRIWSAASFPVVGVDAVRAWVAPSNGSISISGNASRSNASGDGVTVSIMQGALKLWSANLAPEGEVSPSGLNYIKVKEGDVIYFAVNAKENTAGDLVRWNPTIALEESAEELGPNLVVNGDFSAGLNNWTPYVNRNNEISADFNVVNGALRVDNMTNSPPTFIRLTYDKALTMEQGKFYTISIDARVDRGSPNRDIAMGIDVSRGLSDEVKKTISGSNMVTYTYVYPHTGPTDTDARLRFTLGYSSVPFTIDNISVREGGTPYPNRPKILVTQDGQEITDIETWEKVGRPQMLKFLRDECYGYPPAANRYTIEYINRGTTSIANGTAVRKLVDIRINGPLGSLTMRTPIYLPNSNKPVPVIMYVKQRSAITDTSPTSRSFPLENELLPRGYGAVVINGGVLISERPENTYPLYDIFENKGFSNRTGNEWGSLSMWAWAGSLILDYMEKDPDIDMTKIGAIGHSRGAKGALWFAATEKRIALVMPNNGGVSGFKLFRHRGSKGQELEGQVNTFGRWFAPVFKKYANMDDDMPWESYNVMSLVAPRLVAAGSSAEDGNANPVGQWQSFPLVQPIYELYGKTDKTWQLTDGPYSRDETTILRNGNLHHHRKPGPHSLTRLDWRLYLDFADIHWK